MSTGFIPRGALKISEMSPGDGWVVNRLFEDEPNAELACQRIAILTQVLFELEVTNSKGLTCPRPS